MRFCIAKSVEAGGNLNHVKFNSWYDLILLGLGLAKSPHEAASMSTLCRPRAALALAVTTGISCSSSAALLALHRSEEPETGLLLREVDPAGLHSTLANGSCDMAIAFDNMAAMHGWDAEPLWQEELAVALPKRSVLATRAEITIELLRTHPVQLWPPDADRAVGTELVKKEGTVADMTAIASFELLALLVAAGYCVGIAPLRRIEQAQAWGIVARPLAGRPLALSTLLLRAPQAGSPAAERFAERARRIAASRLS